MRKIITLLLFSWIACVSQASIQKTIGLLSSDLNESETVVNEDVLEKGSLVCDAGEKEIFNGVNVSEHYSSPRCSAKQAETMIVEGRTWWYYCSNSFDYPLIRAEIGLTLQGTKEIDGKTWHIIRMRMGADIDTEDTAHPFKFDAPMALIREEDNKVYAMVDETCTPTLEILTDTGNEHFIFDSPALIYGFGNVGDIFTVYEGKDVPTVKYKIAEIIPSSDTTPTLYKCDVIFDDPKKYEPQQIVLAGGIGITSTKNLGYGVYGRSEIFFAPFGALCSCTARYGISRLRYVTDGEDNTVIYTGEGGYRLWEKYDAVESVLPDVDGADDGADVRYYNLQGQPVPAPIPGTVTIRRTSTSVTKIRMR